LKNITFINELYIYPLKNINGWIKLEFIK